MLLHSHPPNQRASAKRASTNHPLTWFSQVKPAGTTRKTAHAAVPSAVIIPLKGTMGMLARRPAGETRLQLFARMGRVTIVAATVMATDSSVQRTGRGRGPRAP